MNGAISQIISSRASSEAPLAAGAYTAAEGAHFLIQALTKESD